MSDALQEDHPWNWYGPDDSQTLIAGTFPPTRNNWSFDFFYPNKTNFFWRVMSAVANKPLQFIKGEEAVAERKALLDSLKLTVTDMGKTIRRLQNNSLDENLEAITFMDIQHILQQKPGINKIIFTSSSGKSNAAKWFQKYITLLHIPHKFPKGNKPVKSQVTLAGRKIELVILYSPSARAANRISFERLVELYKTELL
ncbi:hypothetical protein [Polluticaenibacter yanchengensis]|uniref:Uracil-DNA glycosylase family protein n=1 Tax=Polluticaenibacter yanchengensis TaxID=3014562 RepID=A0ABT4UPD1_9BACT|nr:hypothetical protein [Chitinophagaceae bacterium LY-5]